MSKRTRDCVSLAFGGWVLLSPWIVRLPSEHGIPAWGAALLAGLVVVLAGPFVLSTRAWQQPGTFPLALTLLVAPWLLDFTGRTGAEASALLVAVWAGVLGVSSPGPDIWRLRLRRRRTASTRSDCSAVAGRG